MGIFSSAWDFASVFIVFVFGAATAVFLNKKFHCTKARVLFLYAWHTLFCLVYFVYELKVGGDPLMYYGFIGQDKMVLLVEGAPRILSFFRVGTSGILAITEWFRDGMGFSFLAVFFVFNIFGFIGLVAFDASLREISSNSSPRIKRFATFVVLLPSVSFWSSAIGKDSITFMASGLALWAALDLKRRKLIMACAFFAMFFSRPHIAVILIVALGVAVILGSGRIGILHRSLMIALTLSIAFLIFPLATKYVGLKIASPVDVYKYIERRQDHFKLGSLSEGGGTGSNYDIAAMSPPMQLFTYMFRPLLFDAHNAFAFFTAIENMILLAFLIYTLKGVFVKKRQGPIYLFLWLFVLLAGLILSSMTGNLGIAARQKWMFMPFLIFLLFAGKAACQEKKLRRFLFRKTNPELSSLDKNKI